MKLKDFIKKFIGPNSLVRLWKKLDDNHGYLMLTPEAVMEWEIMGLSDKITSCDVMFVKDIFCETYREAINIVIDSHISAKDVKDEIEIFRSTREVVECDGMKGDD